MKHKRTIILALVFLLVGAATVFADTVYEKYTAKKITVMVNNVALEEPGLIVDMGKDQSRTMLPLREISDAIGGLTTWNEATNTLSINKPNVHLTTLSKDQGFGIVRKGKVDFIVIAQVDNLQTKVSSLKVTIVDPFGQELDSYIDKKELDLDTFWLTSKAFDINFKYFGNYTVNFYMKTTNDSEFQLVSQKIIHCKPDAAQTK